MLKVSWRTTSDMAKPQFDKPQAANFTTVEASNGAKLEVWYDRLNIRPYVNTLLIRVGRGYLRQGDTLTIRFGDRRQGSPGWRLQTNCEKNVELKTSVDAFATYEFCELPAPGFDLVPGPAASWKAILPSLAVAASRSAWRSSPRTCGAIRPTRRMSTLASHSRRGRSAACPRRSPSSPADGPRVIENLVGRERRRCRRCASWPATGRSRAPIRCASSSSAPLRRYWGDLHGQSGETVGMGSAEDYFRYARDTAFVDMVGHQGNDFQITDAFWTGAQPPDRRVRRARAASSACPATNGPATPAWAATATSSIRREGRPIRRSSHILVQGQTSTRCDLHRRQAVRVRSRTRTAVVIAHVGGRYADMQYAHDGRLERAVEVHSSWGTFEWLLHDAFEKGYRVGVVCHSDDHKGRPGATRPGASTFGAIGGLTCYFMPELTRDALFEALRQRRHYGTTGTRLFLDLRGTFASRRHRLLRRSAARPRDRTHRRATR